MPLWIFTVGKTIFDQGDIKIPFGQIASYVYSLIIPILIGLFIQRKYPRAAQFLVRILKSCSAILIVFIVTFAIFTNLYLFKLFTWEVSAITEILLSSLKTLAKTFSFYMNLISTDFHRWISTTMVRLFCWLDCINKL